jgi:hypothetical protein
MMKRSRSLSGESEPPTPGIIDVSNTIEDNEPEASGGDSEALPPNDVGTTVLNKNGGARSNINDDSGFISAQRCLT